MANPPKEQSNRRIRILLTGFGRFPGAPKNPSAAIVAEIARSRRLARFGLEIVAAVFPVEFGGFDTELTTWLAATRPDAVLHLGLAGRRRVLTVETRAANRLSQLHPDALRRMSGRAFVVAGAPDRLKTRLPAARLVAAMNRTGTPARLSHDAGDYVCNATLYLSLRSAIPVAGFIHVPWPRPENRPLSRRRSGTLRPSREEMVRAIGAALPLIAAEVRHHRRLS
jgi:pyroglutamyl-peptidase